MVGPGGGALDEQGRSPALLGSVGVGRTSQGAALNERRPEGINGGADRGSHVVDNIEGSAHHNMKELRCSKDGALRALFIFDPLRRAVLLLGGDKSEGSKWYRWYAEAIPQADALYEQHLAQLREEGRLDG